MKRIILASIMAFISTASGLADTMRVAVTTSFHNSGLSDVLLPRIAEDIGLDVQLLVVGTGQALRLGAAGDVDAILVHSRAAEEAFVEAGHGTHRRELMYNDFVIIGPSGDPARISNAISAAAALEKIGTTKPVFVSRGDDSGTHKKEVSLWAEAKLDPESFGGWYRAVGAGMGAALNAASGMDAYILADRASWLNFGNKGDLDLLFSGDPALFNQYAYIPVDPLKHDQIKSDLALKLESWLTSEAAQKIIDGYEVSGEKLFTFNAK